MNSPDVIGDDKVAALDGSPGAGQLEQRQRPARADPNDHLAVLPGRGDQVDDVAADVRVDIDLLDRGPHGEEDLRADHRLQRHDILLAFGPPP